MVSALDSGASGPGSSSGRGHGVVFLARHNSYRASLHPGVYSCFEKGCPIKPYATMLKGIMGNEALGVSAT